MRHLRPYSVLFPSLLVVLVSACAYAAAQEPDTAPAVVAWQAALADWLTSPAGRLLVPGIVYALVALLKLVPLRAASPGAKIMTVVCLSLTAGATALGAGASPLAALGTTVAAATGAIGCHEMLGRLAEAALPLLVRLPRVGPAVAAVVRALFAPSAATVEELVADSKGRVAP